MSLERPMTTSKTLYSRNDFLKVFVPGFLVLFVPVLFLVFRVVHYCKGHFVYPFDDTFIHLTIADNLLKGTWGINEGQFVSASSSVLYTLILALFRVVSKSELVPLIVNCIAAFSILVAVHIWLKRHFVNYLGQVLVFLLVVLFTPLPLLIVSGMEHTLQCLFSFLFIFFFSDWLEAAKDVNKHLPVKLLILSVLVTTIRYEGMFLIAVAVLLLIAHKKLRQAVVLAFISMLPLLIFGLVSMAKGNYFLPNSILVKSDSLNYSTPFKLVSAIFFEKLIYARNGMAALATQRLLIILPFLYLAFKNYIRPSYLFILTFLFGATVLQLSFASTGYLYRYEAYLFFCLMIVLPILVYKYGMLLLSALSSIVSRLAAIALAFFLFYPVALRGITAWDKTSQASINIFEQQFQMASFCKKYYNQSAIALNDIGAVGYYTNSKIIDLWGLANIDVTKSRRQHNWTPTFLDSVCNNNKTQIAIIYDSWFSDSLTKRWSKAATWQIKNNVICGDSVVSFYSLDSYSKNVLQGQLRKFESDLPRSVIVKYY